MAYDFVIGVDVGKYFHHACVLDPQGRQVLSKRINQHEGSLRTLFGQFLADNASVLVIVDQPNNIGRLTVALARRRLNALFSMMRNGEHYRDISTAQEAAAA